MIVAIFGTSHNNCTVVLLANICCDLIIRNRITVKHIFRQIFDFFSWIDRQQNGPVRFGHRSSYVSPKAGHHRSYSLYRYILDSCVTYLPLTVGLSTSLELGQSYDYPRVVN